MSNLRTRKPRILIDPPYIPTTLDKKHVGTRVQFSKSTDFNDSSSMVFDKTFYSPEDILNIQITKPDGTDLEISLDDVYYFRYQLIYDSISSPSTSPDNYTKDSFSIISSVYGDQEGFKFDHIVITTPRISLQENNDDVLNSSVKITLSNFKVLVGSGKHKYTTWIIESSDGREIFRREKDEDNLTEIKLETDLFQSGKLYIIKAKFITDTNGESNYGRYLYNMGLAVNPYLKVENVGGYEFGSDLFFKISPLVPNLTGVDVKVVIVAGNTEVPLNVNKQISTGKVVIKSFTNNKGQIILPDQLGVKTTNVYRVYFKPIINNRQDINWSSVVTKEFLLTPPKVYLEQPSRYPGKYSLLKSLNLGGIVINSRELKNGIIPLVDNSSNKIKLFSRFGQSLRPTMVELNFPMVVNDIVIPYVNFVELYNGYILMNYVILDNNNYKKNVWAFYQPDYLTNSWKYLKHVIQDDEKHGTSPSSCCVALLNQGDNQYQDSQALYIANSDTQDPMKIRKIKITDSNNTIDITDLNLPTGLDANVRTNVSLVPGLEPNTFYLIGGTSHDRIEIPGSTGVYKYRLLNRKIFKGTLATQLGTEQITWVELPNTLPSSVIPDDLYCFGGYVRGDKKIVLFNNTHTGSTSSDSSSYVIDTDKMGQGVDHSVWLTKENNDSRVDLPFRTTVAMRNGDFLRLSYIETVNNNNDRENKVLLYPHLPLTDYVDTDTDIMINKHLNIPVGKVISIENPYLYDTITIEGDRPDNTGILIWTDQDKQRVFDYSWKIITRNTEVTSEQDRAQSKEKLFILDGVQYTVKK